MIALLLAVAVAQAPITVRGRILDGATGIPVPHAVIQTADAVTRSDGAGRFALSGLAPGEQWLRVRRVGYGPEEVRVRAIPGVPVELEIRLIPLPQTLATLEVREPAAAPVMSGDEARARGRTLAEALDGWEGVTVQRRAAGGSAAPILRGSAPHEVLVLVDGVPLNDPWTGVADLSRVSTAGVEQVRVVPGAQGATYGARAIAGALVVHSGVRSGVGAAIWTGSYGAVGAGVDGTLSAGRWRVGLDGEVERAADAYPVSLPATRGGGESRRENAGASLVRAAVRVDGPVRVSARGHHARRGLPGTLTNPSVSGVTEETWVTASAWDGPLLLAVDALVSEARDTNPPLGAAYRSTVRALGLEGVARFTVGALDVEGGARVERVDGTALGSGGATVARAHLAVGRPVAGAAGSWRLAVAPRARLDGWTQPGSPALSLRVDASGERGPIRLHLGAGSTASHPVLADHLFHEGVAVRPNPTLRPERVPWEVEVGAATRWRARGLTGLFTARGYLGRVDDLVLWAPDFRFVWSPANFHVRRRGIDLGAQASLPTARLTATASYAATSVRYDRPGAPQVIYRPRDVASASLVWEPPAGRVAVSARRIGERFPNHGGVNPLAPATVWDVVADRSIPLGGATMAVSLALRDIFDRRVEHVAGQPLAGRSLTLRVELSNR